MNRELAILVHEIIHFGFQLRDQESIDFGKAHEQAGSWLDEIRELDGKRSKAAESALYERIVARMLVEKFIPNSIDVKGLRELPSDVPLYTRLVEQLRMERVLSESPIESVVQDLTTCEYALSCWLDEILSKGARDTAWENNLIEVARFNLRDRAEQFWTEANEARNQYEKTRNEHDRDTVEVFALCVRLGFIGGGQGAFGADPSATDSRTTFLKKCADLIAPPNSFQPYPRRGELSRLVGRRLSYQALWGGVVLCLLMCAGLALVAWR